MLRTLHNFLSIIHCPDVDLDLFWTLATSPIHSWDGNVFQILVLKKGHTSVDSLEKSLWILRLRFKFLFTSPLITQEGKGKQSTSVICPKLITPFKVDT